MPNINVNTIRPLQPFWFKFLTLLLAVSIGSMAFAVEQLSDAEKRQRIEKLYLGYRIHFPETTDIDPLQAFQFENEKNILLIDARQQKEQAVSMLPGAITANVYLKNMEKYKHHLKIAYCTVGYCSGKFAQKLSKKGIQILNLRGGILAWVHAGGKVQDQSGPTDRIHVFGR